MVRDLHVRESAWSDTAVAGKPPGRLHVLVVEDNPADARLVTELLREAPEFIPKASARLGDAVARLQREPCDAVLLDLLLPDARGEGVLRAVLEAAPDVAIVVLTGLGDELELARRAIASGAEDFIPKNQLEPTLLSRALVTAVERRRLRRALEQRERQLKEAHRLARIGDFWWQPGQAAIGLSSELCAMLGCGEGALSLRALLRRAAPEARRRLIGAIRAVWSQTERVELTLRARGAGGEMRDFRVGIERRGPARGRNSACFGICQDVTDQLAVARMKDEFVSIVSHELRTPLTCVLGAVSAVRGLYASNLPEQARALLESAHRNGQRLQALVDDLLDLQRIASGSLRIRPQSVDFIALCGEVVAQYQPEAVSRGVALRYAHPPGPLPGVTDPVRFGQILGNLLANAVKFSPPGSAVAIRLSADQGRVRVAVVDHGPGIPPELQGRIFERFVQVDSSDRRARQGSGLGLAIVRELSALLGGQVAVDSAPGRGSTFTLTLPLAMPRSGVHHAFAENADAG
jgi:signal transduction histidine kinase